LAEPWSSKRNKGLRGRNKNKIKIKMKKRRRKEIYKG
jgi:hypothetical protein